MHRMPAISNVANHMTPLPLLYFFLLFSFLDTLNVSVSELWRSVIRGGDINEGVGKGMERRCIGRTVPVTPQSRARVKGRMEPYWRNM